MKVLYISNFKDGTGWSKASHGYILALDAAGVDVVPRAVKLNNATPDVPERILELEAKSSRGCTHVIQHVLPHYLDYNGRFEKNIALCVYESFDAKLSSWPSRINLMDELWVPSAFTEGVFRTMDVTVPIEIVPHTFDLSIYDKKYEKLDHPELDGNFIFYTIADMNKRKDLLTMIQAFHLEFTANEPVKLLIKTGRHGMSAEECAKIMIDECTLVKRSMKLMRRPEDYSQEVIISDNLSNEDINRLHATGDCFVTTTHGEAWSIPLFDAVAFGKNCIYPQYMFPYLPNVYGFECDQTRPVFGMNDTFADVGSSRESWYSGAIPDIRKKMRRAYNKSRVLPKQDMSKYSYLSVGMRMKELLN